MSASTTTATLRAAVYGRESQASAASIERQIALGTRLAVDRWTLAGTYDDGSSASRFARKGRAGWKDILYALQHNDFDVLVLWEQSRGHVTSANGPPCSTPAVTTVCWST